jgi:peptidoglycan/xylan/chitin deacetylase (PgdA/CDA1 family)
MRALIGSLRRRFRRARPAILMYHRIASPRVDPWGLSVRPEHFEQHLAVLRGSREALSMSELVERLERGTLPANAVAVTFDDGYADNLHVASPRLAAAGVPATVFLATGYVGRRHEYWWDELARGILAGTTAVDTEVPIGAATLRVVLPAADGSDSRWRAWQPPQTPRQRAYLSVWTRLRAEAPDDREAAMVRLRDLLEIPPPEPGDLPMSAAEVAAMAAGGVFEFGGHTVSHPALPGVAPPARRDEIRRGRAACEGLIGRRITGFAYPHGALDEDSKAAVRECGFAWACSTESRALPARADRYALPRLGVLDWDGPTFAHKLQELSA